MVPVPIQFYADVSYFSIPVTKLGPSSMAFSMTNDDTMDEMDCNNNINNTAYGWKRKKKNAMAEVSATFAATATPDPTAVAAGEPGTKPFEMLV